MPEVIIALAPEAFAAAAGFFASAGVAVSVSTLGSVAFGIITIAGTVGLNALLLALKNKAAGTGGNLSGTGTAPAPTQTQQTVRQPIPARLRNYGQVKVAGPLAWYGVLNGRLFALIMLGQGKIANILEYWLNNAQVTLDANGNVTDLQYIVAGQWSVVNVLNDGGLYQLALVGYGAGGAFNPGTYYVVTGIKGGGAGTANGIWLVNVISINLATQQAVIDLIGSAYQAGYTSGGEVGPLGGAQVAQIVVANGDDNQAANAQLITAFPGQWTTNHRLQGVATAMVAFQDVPPDSQTAVYPSGVPAFRLVAQFTYVYDPRAPTQNPLDKTTWQWSDNAALVILDYLTHADGFNRPRSLFNVASFQLAAQVCDNQIPLAAGGTEPRYRIWNTYDLTEKPADVLNRLLAACDGYLYQLADGTWGLRVGIWEQPSVSFADADVISYQLAQGNNALAAFNQLTVTFVWSVNDYQQTQAQDWEDAASIATYGERTSHLDLPAVPSPSQARRLAKVAMAKGNPAWTGKVVLKPRGLAALGEKFVNIAISELGIATSFLVQGLQLAADLSSVTLDVISLDATAYSWNPAVEEGSVPVTTADIAFGGAASVPTSFTWAGVYDGLVPGGGGAKYIVLTGQWNTVGVRPTLTAELNWRRQDGSSWNVILVPAMQNDGWVSPVIAPLTAPSTYEARVRWRGPSGMPSDWSATLTTTL